MQSEEEETLESSPVLHSLHAVSEKKGVICVGFEEEASLQEFSPGAHYLIRDKRQSDNYLEP